MFRTKEEKPKKEAQEFNSSSSSTLNTPKPAPQTSQTSQTSQTYQTSQKTPTRVYIRFNAGFPNNLFIRGKGGSLSWDKGIPLKNLKPDLWLWECDSLSSNAEFKILLNDRVYEEGVNRTVSAHGQIEYTPFFRT